MPGTVCYLTTKERVKLLKTIKNKYLFFFFLIPIIIHITEIKNKIGKKEIDFYNIFNKHIFS